jgi:hypothetical protein
MSRLSPKMTKNLAATNYAFPYFVFDAGSQMYFASLVEYLDLVALRNVSQFGIGFVDVQSPLNFG